ncbi:hypothetical protein OCH239_05340 [Roseivivax halodurans JCM 10272]|uniref:Entericidin n=1 Tax=Roseivivax halodurans JCM 10272 TaxID=1449350 RepID=X7EDW6_9RHOB|nr:entericidin A/B family lipoprotein [Roseivivax halodurans]ETX14065.1 hypothetical protein OCH239_05340 [Roseivivax halodurans JCM 10272]
MTLRLLALFGLLGLAACETIGGAGQDISSAGNAISNQAQETERELEDD